MHDLADRYIPEVMKNRSIATLERARRQMDHGIAAVWVVSIVQHERRLFLPMKTVERLSAQER